MNALDPRDRRLHDRALDLAATAVDFELTLAESDELEAHLTACQTCPARTAALRSDAQTLRRPLVLLPSARVDDAVAAAIARRSGRSGRLLLLAAAALLLVALLGIVAVGASLVRDLESPPITVVPSPPALGDASPGPQALPPVVGETWAAMDIPASDVGSGWIGLMRAVAATESGFVAVGRPVCAPQNDPTRCHASVWTASPGEGWTRAPDQPGLEVEPNFPTSGPEPGMLDVAAGPGGVVAIGYASGPTIWHSPDGRTWERVQADFAAEGFGHRIVAVTAGPQGYVIVGYVIDQVGPAAFRARAVAWTSPDGVAWTRAADAADMDVGPCQDTGEEPSCGGMRAVVATDSGFVAVGEARTPVDGQAPQPAAWTSPDGLTWTRADVALGVGGADSVNMGGSLSGVTVGGPGLIAVGTICQPDCFGSASSGVAVSSADGSSWSGTPVTGAPSLQAVASTGELLFALGTLDQDAGRPAELQLWRSEDGASWQRATSLPSIPDATFYANADLAATSDRAVVVGWADVSGPDTFRNFSYMSPAPGSTPNPSDAPNPTPSASPVGTTGSSIDPVVLPGSGSPRAISARRRRA